MTIFANTPKPPYFAVIFSSKLSKNKLGYHDMANKMEELASKQPGYLGFETAKEHIGISVSYWSSLESIKNWKNNLDHQTAQKNGKAQWYSSYKVRIAKVERDYSF